MYLPVAAELIALDAATGAIKWRYQSPNGVATNRGATVAEGKVFTSGGSNTLIALDSATGKLLWTAAVWWEAGVRTGECRGAGELTFHQPRIEELIRRYGCVDRAVGNFWRKRHSSHRAEHPALEGLREGRIRADEIDHAAGRMSLNRPKPLCKTVFGGPAWQVVSQRRRAIYTAPSRRTHLRKTTG